MAALWTQEEAINFECARETISHVMAILTGEIAAEMLKNNLDHARVAQLDEERSQLAHERELLSVSHHAQIDTILKIYGARVRASRAMASAPAT